MSMKLMQSIQSLVPNAEVVIRGDVIEWIKEPAVIPTPEEIQAEIERLDAVYLATEYQRKRAAEYPPLSDLADGMVKQSSTDPLIKAEGDAQVAKYFADCLAVKALYPKEAV